MSSFFSQASFVMDPSVYRAGTLFVPKPTDGSGDLNVTRSNDTATRVGPDGLIEKVRTNRVLHSNDFTNAAWIKFYSIATAGQEDPFGGTNGTRIVTSGIGGYVYQNGVCVTNTEMTASFWVKSNTGSSQDFIIAANGGSQASSAITATTSWQRVSFTFQSSSSGDILFAYQTVALIDLLIYGFQLETGVMTNYIPTTTAAVSVGPVANVPRLDYLNSNCPRLLLEPQRTNLLIYSENSALWQQPADGLTVVYNTTETLDPAGFNGAEKVTFTGGNGRMFEAVVNAVGSVTMSAFVKAGTGNTIRLRTTSSAIIVDFNLTTQTITPTFGTGTITNYGNGWYRVTATGTSATTPEVAQYVFPNTAGQFVYFYGAQFEQGAYATSYIPTLGAAVTRGADDASKTGISSLIGQSEGTAFIECTADTTNSNGAMLIYLGSSDGGGAFNYSTYLLFSGTSLNLVVYSSGAIFVNSISTQTYTNNETIKAAFGYKNNDFVCYANGVQLFTDTSGTVSTNLSSVSYGSYPLNLPFNQYNGKISQALLFKTRLSNADLAALTA